MLPALSEQLTQRFYAWEQRGRGWHTFDFPVELEPEFHPFFGHFAPPQEAVDDGKRHTIFSGIGALFSKKKAVQNSDTSWAEIPPVTAFEYEENTNITAYSIVLPKDGKFQIEDMEHLLLMLSYTNHLVSFEIVGTSVAISLLFACRDSDAPHVYEQVKAYFPTVVITKNEKRLEILKEESVETCVIDFGLTSEFMRPLRMGDEVDRDPYIGLYASLERIITGERGAIQILFKGTINPWPESIMRAVSDGEGGSFFADAPEMVKLAQQKISAPLYAVCIRVFGQADKSERAIEIAKNIGTALIRLTGSSSNKLQMLSQNEYPLDELIDDVLLRESHRLGMLLNLRELATLVHFPTPEELTRKVEQGARKTKAAPNSTCGHQFVLGKNVSGGVAQQVSVPASLRLRHTHLIGATGTGKSTLLLSMIAQDMQHGNGLAVLDPHGDLIEAALAYVPEDRINDMIVVDPADGEFPVAFNILSAHSEIEKDILSSDLVAAFKRLSTSWGDQMNSVLANAILAFLESNEGGTLVDLRRFLVEKSFRDSYLKTVQDQHVVYYWQHEYPLLKGGSIGSILTRLDTFLRPKLIRNMVAQKTGLDFENILDSRKILFVKLSQGLIGAENSFLLGTFFVSKMYQAAMARQARSKEERSDFFLYIDEFQNFITPSMSHILSGARKYHLGLILAHQDMQQLQKYDSELASSVVVNAGTRICFRLGDTDAKRFAGGFSYFEAEDLENLRTGEAIARIEQPSFDFSLTVVPLPQPDTAVAQSRIDQTIEHSRQTYGTPRNEVEALFESLHTEIAEHPKKEKIQEQQRLPEIEESITAATVVPPISSIAQTPPVVAMADEAVRERLIKKRETTQHRYLQSLIKKMAEARGYKANIEELTPDGKGRVDVSLERNGKRIACEVCVTTEKEWEVHNIEKCLAAGFDIVVSCSSEKNTIDGIRKKVQEYFSDAIQARLYQFQPEQLFQFLDEEVAKDMPTEKRVKGYRVKVKYAAPSDMEMHSKREAVSKAVLKANRK